MKVLISAGPTREAIDPVRFISNRSSGKMGYALARAAKFAGHEVLLVSSPTELPAPHGIKIVKVETAAEMGGAMKKFAKFADIIIMAAAVADYRPLKSFTSKQKIKKNKETLIIKFVKTEDILASLGRTKKKNQILVGFAAETEDLIENAEKKLLSKNLDWIIANDVSRKDIAFESDDNEVVMLSKNGRKIKLPKSSKLKIAKKIIKIICNDNSKAAQPQPKSSGILKL